eukprot:gene22256-26843_t
MGLIRRHAKDLEAGGEFIHKIAGKSTLAAAALSKNISVAKCPGGGVIRSGIDGFNPSEDPMLFEITYDSCFSSEDTLALALSGLANDSTYRLLEANCEHFATWCKTGEKVSFQVLTFRSLMSQLAALSAGAVVGTSTLTQLDLFKSTTVEVQEKKGTLLGLRDKTVTVLTTEVKTRQVLGAATIIGFASAVTYKAARGLIRMVWRRTGKMFISITVEPESMGELKKRGSVMKNRACALVACCKRPRDLDEFYFSIISALK